MKNETEKRLYADVPFYWNSGAYAVEHNEGERWQASLAANAACARAMEEAVAKGFTGNRFDAGAAANALAEEFGRERAAFTVAATINLCWSPKDLRISRENRAWAEGIPMSRSEDAKWARASQVHPGLLNMLADKLRQGPTREQRPRQTARLEKNAPAQSGQKPSLSDRLGGARKALGTAPAIPVRQSRGREEGR